MFDLLNITLSTSIVKLPLLDTGSKCHACCSNLRYTRSSWRGSLALLWVNFGLLGTNLLLLLLSHEGIELRVSIPFFLWNYSELLLLHYLLLFFDHELWDFHLFNKLVIFHFNNFYYWLLSHHTLNGFWNLHRLLLLFLRCFLLDFLLLLYLDFVLPPLCGWVRQYLFNLLIMTTTLHEYFLVQCITDILNLFLMMTNLFTFTCNLAYLNFLPIVVLFTDFYL